MTFSDSSGVLKQFLKITRIMKMQFQTWAAICLIAAITSCHPARLVYSPGLQSETAALSVKGRNGFQIGQKLSFGGYQTGKIRRGWTSGYEIPFRVSFRGAKEKLSYDLVSPDGARAEVSCISKFKAIEYQMVKDYFSIPLQVENFFAGNIFLQESGTNWDFIVYNPEGGYLLGESSGYAQNGAQRIDFIPIRKLEGQPAWLDPLTVYGYELALGEKVLGAVSLMNRGEVRLADGVDPELKLVVASLATGLLLRHSPADSQG
jgi:hypothetical protein